MKRKLMLAFVFLIPFQLLAQEKWGLRECIEFGLKFNRNSVVYANEKLAADAKAKEALSEYLPKISVNATLDDNLKVQESVIPAGVFGPTDIKVAFSQKYNTNGVVQLDQTIFDRSLLIGLKANKYSAQMADLNIKKSRETIIYNIANAYYQINVYREQLVLLKENLDTYRKQMEVSALQVQKGVKLKKDLDKVTVDYNNATSQLRVAESNLTLAENQLKYEMGFPFSGALIVDRIPEKDLSISDTSAAVSSGFAVANRVDYQLSEVNAKMLDIDQNRIKSGWLPKLTGYARYGANGFGNTLSPALKDMNAYSAIGLKLNIPLFDFFKRNAQYNQAKYKSLNASENLKLDAGRYELEYENAKTKMVKAQSSLESDRRNIELAQSVFTVTDLQYKKGVETLTEWLNAQNSIKEAQNNYLNSLYSFLQAKLDLEKATGSLNTFYTAL
ncbi:MAG: TolC family protein [Chryseobacterium sp.]|nr:MAG: TolC family protein [Chryseobacterium sp.]